MQKQFQQFTLKQVPTVRFLMNPVELKDYIDFDVRRVYYLTDIKENTGQHCHKIEEEFFILIQGSCTAILDQGKGLKEIALHGPSDAVYVPALVWHGFKNFSADAILLALSSTNYNHERSDYAEDYEEFKKMKK